MTSTLRNTTFLARVLLSLIFVMSGFAKLADPAGTIAYIQSVGAPFPQVAYGLALIAELGCGLALLIGFQSRIAALGLAVFTLAAALIFHHQFNDQIQMIMFMKNITIMGGLLLVVAHGSGGFSLDQRKA